MSGAHVCALSFAGRAAVLRRADGRRVPRACLWSRAQCEASQQKPIAMRITFYIKPDLDGLNPEVEES